MLRLMGDFLLMETVCWLLEFGCYYWDAIMLKLV
ncbi:hypothetical protein DET47_11420 [Shewanella putrefaciens]|nr:hypothetical protein DET47_11420 [Shewanella putrefaciens]